MKFIMTMRFTGTRTYLAEEIEAPTLDDAETLANSTIERLNSEVKQGQYMRELVSVDYPYTPAIKGDPDYLPPQIGGCWYCNRKEPFTDMCFDTEFDTNVHRGCIVAALERDPEHPEANLQKYLIESQYTYAGIPPEDMPMHPDNPHRANIDKARGFVTNWGLNGHTDAVVTLRKETIVDLLDKEIAFSKGTGMPQFTMGLIQAKKVLVDYIDKGDTRDDTR